jgi:hypothetical protein
MSLPALSIRQFWFAVGMGGHHPLGFVTEKGKPI